MTVPPSTTSVWIATPASWFDLDLDPGTRNESITRMVQRSGKRLAPAGRAELAGMLEAAAADAAAQGAVFAALYSDVLEDRPVSASLVVSLRQAEGGSPPAGITQAGVAHALSHVLGRTASTEVRELPSGPAVRLRRRIHGSVPGQEIRVEVEDVQWFVPSPDGGEVALLAFSTPTLGLAEPFGDLFDAIAGTLRWI
jgi:hypothetical protein